MLQSKRKLKDDQELYNYKVALTTLSIGAGDSLPRTLEQCTCHVHGDAPLDRTSCGNVYIVFTLKPKLALTSLFVECNCVRVG